MATGIVELATAFGAGTVVGVVVKHFLGLMTEKRRQRVETDRATYQERMTQLISANLCALIRSDRYREGEREELAELVQELSDGTHRVRFLDAAVQKAWAKLVRKSAEYGWRRLSNVITETEIADYTRTWEEWLAAARESFGPIPENDRPLLRRSLRAGEDAQAA